MCTSSNSWLSFGWYSFDWNSSYQTLSQVNKRYNIGNRSGSSFSNCNFQFNEINAQRVVWLRKIYSTNTFEKLSILPLLKVEKCLQVKYTAKRQITHCDGITLRDTLDRTIRVRKYEIRTPSTRYIHKKPYQIGIFGWFSL